MILTGPCAFSDFRIAGLQQSIGAKAVRAVWIHYVRSPAPPREESRKKLKDLLSYGKSLDPSEDEDSKCLLAQCEAYAPEELPPNTRLFYITPRIGTVSPWSSKATSIAHVCGFGNEVERIERGMAVAITLPQPFNEKEITWADLLYDRMTQVGTLSLYSTFADSKNYRP